MGEMFMRGKSTNLPKELLHSERCLFFSQRCAISIPSFEPNAIEIGTFFLLHSLLSDFNALQYGGDLFMAIAYCGVICVGQVE